MANCFWSLQRYEQVDKLRSKYGDDIKGDPASYGNNVYVSYNERPADFGIEIYQGNLTTVNLKNFNISYIINPKTNLKINLGVIGAINNSFLRTCGTVRLI